MQTRATIAKLLLAVIKNKQPLHLLLNSYKSKILKEIDQALVQEIVYGTLRFAHKYLYVLDKLTIKPIKEKDFVLVTLLISAFYQLEYMRIPQHAVVNESVAACACNELNKSWAKKLVNAVLRNYIRRQEEINLEVASKSSVLLSHPSWLMKKIKSAWPSSWESILAANNQKPPLVIRVNRQKITRDEYLSLLLAQGIKACAMELPDAIELNPVDITKLPNFTDGFFYVMDLASQLAIDFLNVEDGMRVLDTCAAPGGKACHILDRSKSIDLTLVEKSKNRFAILLSNLNRQGLKAKCFNSSLEDLNWWDRRKFHRILLDAPCSATGVIRRNPDVKFTRAKADIDKLQEQQWHLLNCAWDMLEIGGYLLYATCSILPDENELQIRKFCESKSDAKAIPLSTVAGEALNFGYQILPGDMNMDGFYYCLLNKIS